MIDSTEIWPLYWMVGTSHRSLVGWKKSRGFLSDRSVMNPQRIEGLLHAAGPLRTDAAWVPAAQTYERSLRLRGSPAQDFAHVLSRSTGLPVVNALRTSAAATAAQAQRSLMERLSALTKFEIATRPPQWVYLVDDFVTTGKTLTDAKATLEKAGAQVVAAFTIGLRPRRTAVLPGTAPMPDPMHPIDSELVHPSY